MSTFSTITIAYRPHDCTRRNIWIYSISVLIIRYRCTKYLFHVRSISMISHSDSSPKLYSEHPAARRPGEIRVRSKDPATIDDLPSSTEEVAVAIPTANPASRLVRDPKLRALMKGSLHKKYPWTKGEAYGVTSRRCFPSQRNDEANAKGTCVGLSVGPRAGLT